VKPSSGAPGVWLQFVRQQLALKSPSAQSDPHGIKKTLDAFDAVLAFPTPYEVLLDAAELGFLQAVQEVALQVFG
jgi:hypothetical protein